MKRIFTLLLALILMIPASVSAVEESRLPIQCLIEGPDITMEVYTSLSLGCVLEGEDLFYESSDLAIVSVSETGMIQAVAAGNAQVRVFRLEDETPIVEKIFNITVNAIIEDYSFSFDQNHIYLEKNASYQLKYTSSPNVNSGMITWDSSDSAIVSINNGIVTGHKRGTVTIGAVVNEKRYTMEVTVFVPLQSLAFNPAFLTMNLKDKKDLPELIFVPYDASHGAVEFWIADESIVSLENGVLEAKRVGKTELYASINNVSAKLEINVVLAENEDGALIVDFEYQSSDDEKIYLAIDETVLDTEHQFALQVPSAYLETFLQDKTKAEVILDIASLAWEQVASLKVFRDIASQLKDKEVRFTIKQDAANLAAFIVNRSYSQDLNFVFKLREVKKDDVFASRIDGLAYKISFSDSFPQDTRIVLPRQSLHVKAGQYLFIYPLVEEVLRNEFQTVVVGEDLQFDFTLNEESYVIAYNRIVHANNNNVLFYLSAVVVLILGALGLLYYKEYAKKRKV